MVYPRGPVPGGWPARDGGRARVWVQSEGFHLRRSLRDGDMGELDGPIGDRLGGFGPGPDGWAVGVWDDGRGWLAGGLGLGNSAPAALPNGNAAGGLGPEVQRMGSRLRCH